MVETTFAGLCAVTSQFNQLISECNKDYSSGNEETDDFDDDWKRMNENSTVKKSSPWIYHTAYELKGLPHAGLYKTYGGGGYVKDLIGTAKHAKGTKYLLNCILHSPSVLPGILVVNFGQFS